MLGASDAGQALKDILTDFGKEVFAEVGGDKEIKTSAIVIAVKGLIGSSPIVDRSDPSVNVIKFTKAQRLKLESFFDKKTTTTTGKPSNVKVEHKTLWQPYVLRKATPYLIAAALIGVVAGRYIK